MAALVVCGWLSLAVHVIVFLALFVLPAPGGGEGEMGLGGGGGEFVEIAVAGPAVLDQPQPGLPPQPEPEPEPAEEPPPEPAEPEPAEPEPEPAEEPPPERVVPPRPPDPESITVPAEEAETAPAEEESESEPDTSVEQESEAESDTSAEEGREALEGPVASGTGAEQDSSGRTRGAEGARRLILGSAGLLPGSVAEQRSLLPPPMQCDDPVEGVWRARKYSPLYHDWASFTLRVRRTGNRLHGTITSRLWGGDRFDSTPPACSLGQYDYTVQMRARGSIDGMEIRFGARTYRVVRAHCPSPFFDYNPDNFSGEIDPRANEFESVNNDGGRDVNAPYVFRRTDCDPDA